MLLELLRINVLDTGNKRKWTIRQFDYKCLAPMYVDQVRKFPLIFFIYYYPGSGWLIIPPGVQQRYKICGRRLGDKTYELWAETPENGYSVKGLAVLEEDTS